MKVSCAIVLLFVALLSEVGGAIEIPPPITSTLPNFILSLQNAVTKCDNFTKTDVPYSQIKGTFYLQKITRAPEEAEIRCATQIYRPLVGNNVGLNTFQGITANGTVKLQFLYVSYESGRHRSARLPNLLDFTTVTIVYFDRSIGYVLLTCLWRDDIAAPIRVGIATPQRNPPQASIDFLLQKAVEAGLDVSLADVGQDNCPSPEDPPLLPLAIQLAIAVLGQTIQQALG